MGYKKTFAIKRREKSVAMKNVPATNLSIKIHLIFPVFVYKKSVLCKTKIVGII